MQKQSGLRQLGIAEAFARRREQRDREHQDDGHVHESEPSTQVQDHEDMQTDVGSHGKALHHTLLVCKCTIVYLICM